MRAATIAFALLCGFVAHADELSAEDRLRLIYTRKLAFGPDGLPLISVRVLDGASTASIGATAGDVRLLPDGDEGAQVLGAQH
jgi:hypothetical protein